MENNLELLKKKMRKKIDLFGWLPLEIDNRWEMKDWKFNNL